MYNHQSLFKNETTSSRAENKIKLNSVHTMNSAISSHQNLEEKAAVQNLAQLSIEMYTSPSNTARIARGLPPIAVFPDDPERKMNETPRDDRWFGERQAKSQTKLAIQSPAANKKTSNLGSKILSNFLCSQKQSFYKVDYKSVIQGARRPQMGYNKYERASALDLTYSTPMQAPYSTQRR